MPGARGCALRTHSDQNDAGRRGDECDAPHSGQAYLGPMLGRKDSTSAANLTREERTAAPLLPDSPNTYPALIGRQCQPARIGIQNHARRLTVPRILVTADGSDGREKAVVLQERVVSSDLESDHFSAQLVERVGWALVDA